MMDDALIVSNLRFSPAPPADQATGLLGWLSFSIGRTLRLDGVALRRTLDGHLRLSYPGKKDGAGRVHHHVRPLDDEVRRSIERQVFIALGREVVS